MSAEELVEAPQAEQIEQDKDAELTPEEKRERLLEAALNPAIRNGLDDGDRLFMNSSVVTELTLIEDEAMAIATLTKFWKDPHWNEVLHRPWTTFDTRTLNRLILVAQAEKKNAPNCVNESTGSLRQLVSRLLFWRGGKSQDS